MENRTLTRIKDILWAVAFAGLAASVLRFGLGLGAATGLNDGTPWGLWIAFKLCFVALSGGGFTLAALVYIFHLESFRPILRRAILLALLGYGSFIVSLLFDLGLPWHIYMPVIHWQHHSVMFEIAWCVMLYFSVLIMEFGPVILEHPLFKRPVFQVAAKLLHRSVVPLVIGGIVLSTLHQSSLGSLFLMAPHRVHPLWYTPWIPVLFFVSAIAAGMMALILEGFLAERLFGKKLDIQLLSRLGKIGGFALWIYLVVRLGDLVASSRLLSSLDGSWQSLLFLAEVLLGGVLPAALLLSPKIRANRLGLLTCALLSLGGILSQRMSLSMITQSRPLATPYHPSGLEVIIAFAIPAAAGLIYFFFVENLAVDGEVTPVRAQKPVCRVFDPAHLRSRNEGWAAQLTRRSGVAVLAIACTVAVLPAQKASGQILESSPVKAALGWDILKIDGNRTGMSVSFPHVEHQERLAEETGDAEAACLTCHHLNMPKDEGTGCWECHSDFVSPASIFYHTYHTAALGGNSSCTECHQGEHRAETAVDCDDCHETMTPAQGEARFNYLAPGYQEAMHGLCLSCHEEQAVLLDRPDLAGCATCHYKPVED